MIKQIKISVFTLIAFTILSVKVSGSIGFNSDPSDTLKTEQKDTSKQFASDNLFKQNMLLLDGQVKPKNKLIAIALALTLGPFGVHRLYLGTIPKVPIAYTLTLGGGFFILPLIDIFYIIGNRNPELIEGNNHVFIWNKKRKSDK